MCPEIDDPEKALVELCYSEYAGKTRWRERIGASVTRIKILAHELRVNERGEVMRDNLGNALTSMRRIVSLRVQKIAREVIERMVVRGWIEIDNRGRIFVTPLGIHHCLDRC